MRTEPMKAIELKRADGSDGFAGELQARIEQLGTGSVAQLLAIALRMPTRTLPGDNGATATEALGVGLTLYLPFVAPVALALSEVEDFLIRAEFNTLKSRKEQHALGTRKYA